MAMKKVPVREINRFMVECFEKVGTPTAHANAMADILIAADRRGHFSHGINRLEMYIKDLQSKTCDPCAVPKILKESPSTAWVDGNNGLGPVVGNFCMDLAISKAKNTGVGWVAAKGSNHFGMAAWYTMQALRHQMMASLGTNPISFAAPALQNDSFVLDMATTAVSLGKIEIKKNRREPLPDGWAQDSDGKILNIADVAYDNALLMPLGGAEENSGYKGYGLALMVEALTSISADGSYGPNVRQWKDKTSIANLGHCFVAINSGCFAPGFDERMSDLAKTLRNSPKIDPKKPVLVPGDPEKMHEKIVDEEGAICYHERQLEICDALGKELEVPNMKLVS